MRKKRTIAVTGGVGGAKLADGLMRCTRKPPLTLIINTGDDFRHLGLHVSPDVDTALYTLSGLANPKTGWGRRDETWNFMQALKQIGGEDWFLLGDADLAIHIERSHRLSNGETLSSITQHLTQRLGVNATLLPMSNDMVRTRLDTDIGELEFQHYFVREQCQPKVRGIRFAGSETASPSPDVLHALQADDLGAIILCPSNPYLSIAPILAVPGMREALRSAGVPIIAVSPLVGGAAVKGPTAKIMKELNLPASAAEVARHYSDLIDGFVLDNRDSHLRDDIACPVAVLDTLMQSAEDRTRVAEATLDFADHLGRP